MLYIFIIIVIIINNIIILYRRKESNMPLYSLAWGQFFFMKA